MAAQHPNLMRRLGVLFGRTALGVAAMAALAGLAPASAQSLSIYADSYPVAYFAERIAGELAEVVLPVPADIDPADWSPSVEDIAGYQTADIVLLNGAGLAQWTTQASLSRGRTIDTSAEFADALIATDGLTHSHGPAGEHTHPNVVSLTWLDFDQAAQQADVVANDLKRRLPAAAATIDSNLAALKADLAALDAEAMELGALAAGATIIASHPVYQYFARRYGFRIESLHWEPEVTPPAEEFAALDTLLSTQTASVMIWEGEPTAEATAALAARGLGIVVFDTAINRPSEGDFVAVMQGNLDRLRRTLTGL